MEVGTDLVSLFAGRMLAVAVLVVLASHGGRCDLLLMFWMGFVEKCEVDEITSRRKLFEV